uniref:Uncharacterized protein n=1 Tax=Schistocephalus solidus TaxID=70667 RepID=A0A0V0JC15_SCHSO
MLVDNITEGGDGIIAEHSKQRHRLDHVPSLPADLKTAFPPGSDILLPGKEMHRAAGTVALDEVGRETEDWSQTRQKPDGLDSVLNTRSDDHNSSDLPEDSDMLFELIDEKTSENKKLREQLRILNSGYSELQADLADARLIIAEQQDQLQDARQEIAVSKTNYDALKLKNFILSSNSAGNSAEMGDFVTAYTELRDEVELLRENYREAKELAEQLTKERDFLKKKANQRQIYSDQGTSSGTDEDVFRSGSSSRPGNENNTSGTAEACKDAAHKMQQLREERDRWERYANQLVEKVLETHPELLDSLPGEGDVGGAADDGRTDAERRWYNYAMRLLADAVANNSANISEFDRKLYRSMRRQKESRQAIATACQDARVETSENMAQTRRRRIDRIRDFFRRHKKH